MATRKDFHCSGHRICHARFSDGLYVHRVVAVRNTDTAEAVRGDVRIQAGQWHQVLTVHADVNDIMIDRAAIALHSPLQRITRERRRKCKTIADSGFDFGPFFIIIPGHELQCRQLSSRIVNAIDLGERREPRLPALLAHDAIRSPRSESIVEPFIRGANGLLPCERQSGIVKIREIRKSEVGHRRHDPRIAAATEHVRKSVVVLEK